MFKKSKDKVVDIEYKESDTNENIVLETYEAFVKNRDEDMKQRYEDADKYFDISKKVDDMYKYSKSTSKDEYEMLYLKDTTYERLIKQRELYGNILEGFIEEILSEDLSMEERVLKILYVEEKLQPVLERLDDKIDKRRHIIDESVQKYTEKSENEKKWFKTALYGVAVVGVSAYCLMNPKAREEAQKLLKK